MSCLPVTGSHVQDTNIQMPEPQPSSRQRRVWCPWNKDPSLTLLQRNMLKNMFLSSAAGCVASLGLMFVGATPGSNYAISAVGGSTIVVFFTMMFFVDPLKKIFHELNERTPNERSPLVV